MSQVMDRVKRTDYGVCENTDKYTESYYEIGVITMLFSSLM